MAKFFQWVANRLPRPVVYFAAIRLWAYATSGRYGDTVVGDLTADEAIRRWEHTVKPQHR